MIEYIDRANSSCYKWDSEEASGLLPLWVADMDFKAAPPILDAMQRRLEHGVFGYQCASQAYFDALSSWFSRRHQWNAIRRENSICATSVVAAVSAVLRALTKPGDEVLLQTPAYNCFFSCLEHLECRLAADPLIEKDDYYTIDWAHFEQQVSRAKVFILCNPHNPTGRVWTRDELTRMARICEQHGVFVLADEIHCEITFPGVTYTPYGTVAEGNRYCVCTSATKAFNIAGLRCANIYVPDQDLYRRISYAVEVHEVGELNPFGMEATIAAYNESEQWLDEVQQLIYGNYHFLCDTIRERMPMLSVTRSEGTYLAWVNISALGIPAEEVCRGLVAKQKVLFNPSEMYGGSGHIRINMATSRENIAEALLRLEKFVKNDV